MTGPDSVVNVLYDIIRLYKPVKRLFAARTVVVKPAQLRINQRLSALVNGAICCQFFGPFKTQHD